MGFMTIKFMYSVFAMYLAFSIAGKPALIPGLIGGIMSDEVYKRFFDIDGFMPSGFFRDWHRLLCRLSGALAE